MPERAAWGWALPGARDGAQLARRECLSMEDVFTVAVVRLLCLDGVPAEGRVAYVSGFCRGYKAKRAEMDGEHGHN